MSIGVSRYTCHAPRGKSFEILKRVSKRFFDVNEFVIRMSVYNKEIEMEVRTQMSLNKIRRLFIYNEEFNEDKMEIRPQKKTKTEQGQQHPIDVFEKNSLAQPLQLVNHVVVFDRGTFYQKPVVSYVLDRLFRDMVDHSKNRTHYFEKNMAKTKLLEAFERMNLEFQCACGREHCNEIMQLYGPNGISPDKEDDAIGYCEDLTKITFVIKAHNTPIKPTSNPRTPKCFKKWYNLLSASMKRHTKQRVNQLRKKAKQTDHDKNQIFKFDEDDRNKNTSNKHFSDLLKLKRNEQKGLCFKCNTVLYFGNDNDIVEKIHCPNKASPDRVDDNNIFYEPQNFNLVCCSCNYGGNPNHRTYVENQTRNEPIFFTQDLFEKCKAWLKQK